MQATQAGGISTREDDQVKACHFQSFFITEIKKYPFSPNNSHSISGHGRISECSKDALRST
jgi:hypothetical protein